MGFAWFEAIIAVPAIAMRPFLAEIAEQMGSAAANILGKRGHLFQLAAGQFFGLFVGYFFEEAFLFHHVAARKKQDAFRGQAVSPGAAAGGIRGSVFLDENGDGVRSASELPAVNVTVLLDGRYAVRTDSQGEFEFPRVATGAHTVQVVPDNLPLPWFLAEDGESRAVEVRVRDTTRVDIGARRQR